MSMRPGQSIGPYRLAEKIGEGGMGEVYRAADTKLGRDVALKILPESYAADTGRMARFEREARVLASMNHPNIAALYGMEEADGAEPGIPGVLFSASRPVVAIAPTPDHSRFLAAVLPPGIVFEPIRIILDWPAGLATAPAGASR